MAVSFSLDQRCGITGSDEAPGQWNSASRSPVRSFSKHLYDMPNVIFSLNGDYAISVDNKGSKMSKTAG